MSVYKREFKHGDRWCVYLTFKNGTRYRKVVGTKKGAQVAVNCVFQTITKALKKKDTVTLVGFGTFKVSKRKARKGRNPQTG